MSFGEGDLHARCDMLEAENRELQARNDRLADANGWLCADVNRLQEEVVGLRELARDMFSDYVEFSSTEGSASWPREAFGKRFAEIGLDVPLHECERSELEFEKTYPPAHRYMHDALEKCGMIAEVEE